MRVALNAVCTGINNPTRAKTATPSLANSRNVIMSVRGIIKALVSGGGVKTRFAVRPTVTFSKQTATCPLVLSTGVVNATTVTVNGVVLTATQYRSSGTITFASCAEADTIVVNGVTFTAVTTLAATNDFLMTGDDTATAAAFAAAVMASPSSGIVTLSTGVTAIGAKSVTAIATLFAIAGSTQASAYTLTSSNGTRLAASGSVLTGGGALADNAFDFVATPAINASDLVAALAASTSALVSGQVVGSNRAGIVTCLSVLQGQYVNLDGNKFFGCSASTLTTSATQITAQDPNLFEVLGSDTNTGSALAAAINSHPFISERFWALTTAGAVKIVEKAPSVTAEAPGLTSSNGTALAVSGVTAGLMIPSSTCLVQAIQPGVPGNAITIATSSSALISLNAQARLIGGTSTTATF